MGTLRGIECKLYINTSIDADPYANPTWSEIACIRNATLNLEFEEVDATCRGAGGFRASEPTLTALEVTGDAIKDKDHAAFLAAEAAAVGKSEVDLVVLDGPIDDDDSDGWRFSGKFFSWNENQPYEDIVTVDFNAKPGRAANNPTQFQGSSS